MRLIFDIETDGFLEELTKIHCISIRDPDRGEDFFFGPTQIMDAIDMLELADELIGHNILKFDLPAIKKVTGIDLRATASIYDTLVMVRLLWPELKAKDKKRFGFPGKLIGSQSLEAWGFRLGLLKGTFDGPWDTFTEEMGVYCHLDTAVNLKLFQTIEKAGYSPESFELEHRVAEILLLQESHGFAFNEKAAGLLFADLVEKRELAGASLAKLFKPWFVGRGEFVPKKDNAKLGYTAEAPMTKVELIEFNPASRDHIARCLIKNFGWKPTEFTDGGKPKVDESTMAPLKYHCSGAIMEYLMLDKRIGQIATGKQAWLKHVRNGRIHGAVNTNGAVTGRMTHSHPNIAQVPKVGSLYGKECRSLFTAGPGLVLVGADAAGLELRCLAHVLGIWDEGAYASSIISGDQDNETDTHSLTCLALGMKPKDTYTLGGKTGTGRNFAKTWIYAYLYGAGDEKLGSILGGGASLGCKLREDFQNAIPGMKKLREAILRSCKRGYLIGLDKRRLHVRSAHAALNTLLQSAGALVMKRALVILYDGLTAAGLVHGLDYAFVANVHDEWQIETKEEHAETIGEAATSAIRDAGLHFNFRCPLGGEFKVGNNWADTH